MQGGARGGVGRMRRQGRPRVRPRQRSRGRAPLSVYRVRVREHDGAVVDEFRHGVLVRASRLDGGRSGRQEVNYWRIDRRSRRIPGSRRSGIRQSGKKGRHRRADERRFRFGQGGRRDVRQGSQVRRDQKRGARDGIRQRYTSAHGGQERWKGHAAHHNGRAEKHHGDDHGGEDFGQGPPFDLRHASDRVWCLLQHAPPPHRERRDLRLPLARVRGKVPPPRS
mmetsp:Transcript_33196/g.98652  ORF Transcript_33196/g.98652 Transcript_33196/m.98652 type:complete len:223 (-) Transcript_33196:2800-3468(-)